jgi:N utilization substance protein B
MPIRAETRSRALALQLLYSWDVGGSGGPRSAAWGRLVTLVGCRQATRDRALALAERAAERRGELDGCIARAADRWRIERLGAVDRNVLRLAVLELLEAATPPKVVIDEAVRLAHWFGGGRSPGFVNGVLDRVARDLGRL